MSALHEIDYSEYTRSTQYSWRPNRIGKFHSARIAIIMSAADIDTLLHETEFGSEKVRFVSYKDGIRVGCTYISNDAIEFIYKKHEEFLHNEDCVEHQSGVD